MEKEVVYVAEHIRMYQIDWLAVNGGFVRANIATFGLDKFKGKNAFRTFNLNYDVASSDAVLRADEEHISHIVLVGKNVCHDARNTRNGLWGGKYKELFDEYRVKDEDYQHDLSAMRDLHSCGEPIRSAGTRRGSKIVQYRLERQAYAMGQHKNHGNIVSRSACRGWIHGLRVETCRV